MESTPSEIKKKMSITARNKKDVDKENKNEENQIQIILK